MHVIYRIWTLITICILIFLVTGSSAIKNVPKSSTYFNQNILQEKKPYSGYTLYSPMYSWTTYLIDLEGNEMHTWECDYRPGQATYLKPDGHLLRTAFTGLHPIFLTGGMGGGIQEITWDGSVVWEFMYSGDTYLSHHDIEILPNGNILMIAWEYKSRQDGLAAGRKPNLLPQTGLWPDYIIEIEPIGSSDANIVWEWHAWDHLIQDYNQTKENYGNVSAHPELIDINWDRNPALLHPDWMHTNSIDYNEALDQILISVNGFREIWVIDHSTTTEEAASHSGGIYGKGGDILYRWGNPQTYQRGDNMDQQFFHQHDAQWIPPGLPGAGNILVFNNGVSRPTGDYSSVDEIIPPVNETGYYSLEANSSYQPIDPIWSFSTGNPRDFYSSIVSGVQRFPNGNTLICNGDHGIFFEVTSEKNIIWEYTNPHPLAQNDVFKIERYPPDYPGLTDLFNRPVKPQKPKGPLIGINGLNYSYKSHSIDLQHNQLYYLFNWGDGTNSDWLGPYNSSEPVSASHKWDQPGNYEIKVKAKNINNNQSYWSESSTITVYSTVFNLFLLIIQRILTVFLHQIPHFFSTC